MKLIEILNDHSNTVLINPDSIELIEGRINSNYGRMVYKIYLHSGKSYDIDHEAYKLILESIAL